MEETILVFFFINFNKLLINFSLSTFVFFNFFGLVLDLVFRVLFFIKHATIELFFLASRINLLNFLRSFFFFNYAVIYIK